MHVDPPAPEDQLEDQIETKEARSDRADRLGGVLGSRLWQGIGGVVAIVTLGVTIYSLTLGPPTVLVNVISEIPLVGSTLADWSDRDQGSTLIASSEANPTPQPSTPTPTPTLVLTATPTEAPTASPTEAPTMAATSPAVISAVPVTETPSASLVEEAVLTRGASVQFFGSQMSIALSGTRTSGAFGAGTADIVISTLIADTVFRTLAVGAACIVGAEETWYRVELLGIGGGDDSPVNASVRASRNAPSSLTRC